MTAEATAPAKSGPKKSVALSGVAAGNTALCTVGRTGNDLHYRGYDILDVAETCEFEEIAHLLVHDALPTSTELAAYKAKLKSLRGLPAAVRATLETLPAAAHPMDVMRSGVSTLGCVLPEAHDHNHPGARDIADRLMASLGSMLLYWHHFAHNGRRIEVETDDDSIGGHFLHLLHGSAPKTSHVRAMHTSLNLYAEHEFNASTFTARCIAGTGSDMYSSIAGAIGALRGPKHGGANEVAFFIRQVARASGLPVLVDGDTGYGEALNVMHMVRTFEEAGAAAVHIEDQLLPKKCGHLNDKKLADAHDMAAKVAAAAKARRHLYLIARTDAAASEGIDGAVARARLFIEAGADAIFPEALTSAEMFRAFAKRMPGVPLLANMTEFGRTPFFTASEFQAMGYRMVIWPVSSLRVANKAQEELYKAIARDGGTHNMIDRMQTRAELYATIGLHDYEALDASIVQTIVPEAMPQP